MVKDLERVVDKVKDLLEKYPETRNSDKLLWLAYNCKYNNLRVVFSNNINYQNFKHWLLHNDVPVFESLSRARRMVQKDFPNLQGSIEARRKEEIETKEFIKSRGSNGRSRA